MCSPHTYTSSSCTCIYHRRTCTCILWICACSPSVCAFLPCSCTCHPCTFTCYPCTYTVYVCPPCICTVRVLHGYVCAHVHAFTHLCGSPHICTCLLSTCTCPPRTWTCPPRTCTCPPRSPYSPGRTGRIGTGSPRLSSPFCKQCLVVKCLLTGAETKLVPLNLNNVCHYWKR